MFTWMSNEAGPADDNHEYSLFYRGVISGVIVEQERGFYDVRVCERDGSHKTINHGLVEFAVARQMLQDWAVEHG